MLSESETFNCMWTKAMALICLIPEITVPELSDTPGYNLGAHNNVFINFVLFFMYRYQQFVELPTQKYNVFKQFFYTFLTFKGEYVFN